QRSVSLSRMGQVAAEALTATLARTAASPSTRRMDPPLVWTRRRPARPGGVLMRRETNRQGNSGPAGTCCPASGKIGVTRHLGPPRARRAAERSELGEEAPRGFAAWRRG